MKYGGLVGNVIMYWDFFRHWFFRQLLVSNHGELLQEEF